MRTSGWARNLVRCAGDDNPAVDQHRDAVGKPKNRVHVVLDQEQCHPALKLQQKLHHFLQLLRPHSGHWLIEQKQTRLRCQRQCNFELALLAVREVFARATDARSGKTNIFEKRARLIEQFALARHRPEESKSFDPGCRA